MPSPPFDPSFAKPVHGWLLVTKERLPAPYAAAFTCPAPAGAGLPAGWLLGWPGGGRPHPEARQCDARLLDGDGAAAEVSLVWPDRGLLPLFDDPAVLQARRSALSGPWPRAASALTVDPVHFAGSVWVGDQGSDPFRLVFPTRVLQVGPGLLGRLPRPAGPALERYAGAPWPAGGF